MKQLKMRRLAAPITLYPLPEGYSFALYAGTEEEITDWLAANVGILGENPSREVFEKDILRREGVDAANDLLFVIDPAGKRVATITAAAYPDGDGMIHMVGALPECRGRGIGHAMITKASAMLQERGYARVGLTTDDFRLPAIKTYLDAGFRPVLYPDPESDMRERWERVLAALSYGSVEYIEE